jgi:hypothetical protein
LIPLGRQRMREYVEGVFACVGNYPHGSRRASSKTYDHVLL